MNSDLYDYLIVGQGLAGSLLAHQLITNGAKVLVIDNAHYGSSSQVAAGIINPVTGHRLNITDGFTQYFPVAKQYYQDLQLDLGKQVYRAIDQCRLIKNEGQSEYFAKRLTQAEYTQLLYPRKQHPFSVKQFGAAAIGSTAVVDTKSLLSETKKWLINVQCYLNEKFDHSSLSFHANRVTYKSIETKKIIFCEGFQAVNNPYLSHLPFKLAKGDILSVASPNGLPKAMLSWGNWLVPGDKISKLGSNFVWNNTDLTPSEGVEKTLLDSLHQNTSIRANLVHHEVGVRPSTVQRKPFVGPLSKQANAYCFNGFGSKGCLLIPYYAQALSKHLLNSEPLPKEVTQCL